MRKLLLTLTVCAVLMACKEKDPAGVAGVYATKDGKNKITLTRNSDGKYTVTLSGEKAGSYTAELVGDTLTWKDGAWGGSMTIKGKTATSTVDRWLTFEKAD